MGGETSKANKAHNTLQQERMIDHEMFKRYKYLPQQDWLEITIDVPEEKQMKLWENAVSSTTAAFEHRNCLLLPVKHEYTPKGWCGTIGTAKISYENFPYTFSEELDNRIETGKHFVEEELWYLLYCLVGCAKDFARSQRRIGDVRPNNIFINEQGQVKVACLLSWPFQKTAFEKTAYQKTLTYLAPEEMALLAKGNYQNKNNQVLAESFSIGLTLLAAGLIFRADEIYSVDNWAIDLVKLKNKVNQWLTLQFQQEQTIVSYSPLLRNIVAALCTIEPQDREISLDVEDLLRPYQDEILNIKPFDHDAVEFHPPTSKPHQPQTIVNSQRPVSSRPQQHILTIPPKNYVVSNVVDTKKYVRNGPPAEAYRQTLMQPTKTVQIGYGNMVQLGGVQKNDGGYREVFTQYAANQPETPNQIVIPGQYYQQQFQKYSVMNQQQPQTVQFVQNHLPPSQQIIQQTYSSPPANVNTNLNFKPNAPVKFQTTELTTSPFPFLTSSNFQQSQYVTNTTVQNPAPIAPISSNNDFLRKIDEQLQNSRRLYPS